MAIISREKKAIFLGNPGTGSTSVDTILKNHFKWEVMGEKHDGYGKTKFFLKDNIEDYFVFTTVRNPFDFFVSEYSRFRGTWADLMRSDPNHWIHDDHSVKQRIQIALSGNFEQFVQYYLDNTDAPDGRWRHQYWARANFVMKTESLNNDFRNLLRILKIGGANQFQLHHVNETPNEHKAAKEQLFTPDLVETVANRYSKFLEIFEYEYE